MKKKGSFIDICNAVILDGKPDGLEIAGYEDQDIMFIKAVAITEGVNANDALFERADLERAKRSFVGKPLKIRYVNENPTGHGYDPKTNTFDEIVKAIGVIHDVEAQFVKPDGTINYYWYDENDDQPGTYQLVVYMGVWQKYYPEIANRLRQLHSEGNLKFSIEAEREFDITPEGYRRCFNIVFNGLAVVKNPAFENARSMVVAELLNEGGKNKMDFEKMYQELSAKYDALVAQNALDVKAKEIAEKALEASEGKVTELSETVVTLQGDLKTAQAERDGYKTTVEQAEKVKVGAERLEKLSKYGEVSKTPDELAEMSKDAYLSLLEETVEGYDPSGQENAENHGVQGAYFNTGKVRTASRKSSLLEFVTGLSQ
ncbi:hypothetical protein [Paenibacillus chitinolyticus]|uniref:hypothetical protein n=1 Tax=Paenibacillus chitinolyticus TaxID=79263 RepID=UPI003CFFBE6F